jgi:hypothetical protein
VTGREPEHVTLERWRAATAAKAAPPVRGVKRLRLLARRFRTRLADRIDPYGRG